MSSLPSPETLEAYRALFAFADDIILISDWETARFVDANCAALERLGYTMDELRSLTGGDLSQLPREEHLRFSRELVNLGETRARAVPIRRKDGSLIHMDLSVKRYVADGVTLHATFMRAPPQPAQRKRRFHIARDRLLESEAFYRGVVTCTQDAVVVTDLNSGACIEAKDRVAIAVVPCQHDDRAAHAALAQQAAYFAAIHIGQTDIQDHQIVQLFFRAIDAFGAIFTFEHVKFFREDQLISQRLTQIGVIVNQQNFFQCGHHAPLTEFSLYVCVLT